MQRRLLSLSLALLLLLTQQLGPLHLLEHLLHPAGHAGQAAPAGAAARAAAPAPGEPAVQAGTQAPAGDALCQVCLVLATLVAAALPALCGWLARPPQASTPQPRPAAGRVQAPGTAYQARAPPLMASASA